MCHEKYEKIFEKVFRSYESCVHVVSHVSDDCTVCSNDHVYPSYPEQVIQSVTMIIAVVMICHPHDYYIDITIIISTMYVPKKYRFH